MKNTVLISALLIVNCQFSIVNSCFAQTLKRQCIASVGNAVSINGATVQQTTGQSYGTTSDYGNNIRYNPGFQQPTFKVEVVKSSINARVFPNPTSKQITIETNSALENVIVLIVDMNGKLIFNTTINEFKSYTINCVDWANGVYLISLSDSNNDLYTSRLIIAK